LPNTVMSDYVILRLIPTFKVCCPVQVFYTGMIMRSQILGRLIRASTTRPAPQLTYPNPRLILPSRAYSSGHAHEQESFEEFSERYVKFFQSALDLFEVQRGLNNCFSHDLVPSPAVIEAALRAARRVDDYATAVRVFEGIKEKVENAQQYRAYLDELKGVREELGVFLSNETESPDSY
jgi:cytochrome c oxidase subunit 5a